MNPLRPSSALRGLIALTALTACLPLPAVSQGVQTPALAPAPHDHRAMQGHAARPQAMHGVQDTRELVRYPEAMRVHTLANMRDHLLALSQIQAALARGDFDAAADTAEQRLGMSSLKSHGAHDASRLMPQGMQDIGTAMHRSASRFATAAKDASVSGDVRAALTALVSVTEACVACHAGYRLN
ncbi:MAG: hypothetical protein RLZZ524_773 [Pseudomonadota bacterium]